MDLTFEGSSNLKGGSYDEASRELTLEFHSGASHVYSGVPLETVHGLLEADSAGSYFHRQIKTQHPSRPA